MPSTTDTTPTHAEVRELRHSSRLLVRALGLVRRRIPDFDCTPAQCHVLLELASRGRLRVNELAAVLEVDKSTASRGLGQLERRGLVVAEPDPDDLRSRLIRLTRDGHERVATIQAASDEQVSRALALLTEGERDTVLRGVSLYEKALHRAKAQAGIVVRPIEPKDDEQVADLLREVMGEFGATGAGTAIEDAEIDAMHASYDTPRHAYFVAERAGQILAGAGIGPLAGTRKRTVCELRKMHALPAARGLGVGRWLLESCLAAAREAGYRRCYLETLQHMQRAIDLYEKAGFQLLDAPLGKTGHHACDRWYALDL